MKPSAILREAHERGDRQVRRMAADNRGGMCAFEKIVTDPRCDRSAFGAEARLAAAHTECPHCPDDHKTHHVYVNEMTVHLNDWHPLSFGEIGAWLESLGL